jgi:hypothetical protein
MNNENQNQKSISQDILNKIKKEQVKMRPRLYFIAKTILLAVAFIVTILFILYITSFIVFSLRASGTLFLPRFGSPGIKIFWLSLPWVPILIAGGAVILLELLAKRFNLVYRRPIIYSFLAILALAIIGGFLLEKAPLHSKIFMRAQKEPMHGIGEFYRQFGAPQPKNARFGAVLSISKNSFIIQSPNNETTTIIIKDDTRMPPEYTLKEGDKVSVLGKFINGSLEAFDVREVKGDFHFFTFPPPVPPSFR